MIANRKEFIKKANTLLYHFLWKGQDKVKRAVLISPTEKGGLKMPDLDSMIAAQSIICLKKYLAPRVAGWKFILESYLKKVGGRFLFQCNFNFSKLSLTLPDFYRECILTWSSLDYNNPSSFTEISNQFLWNNKCICIESRSVYNQKLIESGFLTIRDLIDSNGALREISNPLLSSLSSVDHFTLFGLANALPKEWRKVLKANKTPDSLNQEFVDITRFSLFLNGKQLDIEKLQARSLYDHFVSKIATTPTAMKKYNEIYNTENYQLD